MCRTCKPVILVLENGDHVRLQLQRSHVTASPPIWDLVDPGSKKFWGSFSLKHAKESCWVDSSGTFHAVMSLRLVGSKKLHPLQSAITPDSWLMLANQISNEKFVVASEVERLSFFQLAALKNLVNMLVLQNLPGSRDETLYEKYRVLLHSYGYSDAELEFVESMVARNTKIDARHIHDVLTVLKT